MSNYVSMSFSAKRILLLAIGIIMIVAIVKITPKSISAGAVVPTSQTSAPKAVAPAPQIDKSPSTQAKRMKLMRELGAAGIFAKIDPRGRFPRIYVRPAFNLLDFDFKQNAVSIVAAYYCEDELCIASVMDVLTNKEIGDFSRISGLRIF
jgi:hypothetical protein